MQADTRTLRSSTELDKIQNWVLRQPPRLPVCIRLHIFCKFASRSVWSTWASRDVKVTDKINQWWSAFSFFADDMKGFVKWMSPFALILLEEEKFWVSNWWKMQPNIFEFDLSSFVRLPCTQRFLWWFWHQIVVCTTGHKNCIVFSDISMQQRSHSEPLLRRR